MYNFKHKMAACSFKLLNKQFKTRTNSFIFFLIFIIGRIHQDRWSNGNGSPHPPAVTVTAPEPHMGPSRHVNITYRVRAPGSGGRLRALVYRP